MGFGAMLGKMLADCGGAHIATTLIAKFGKQHIQWAVVLTGLPSASPCSMKWASC
jgi:Gnt-I system high-affinity gluconate transporter